VNLGSTHTRRNLSSAIDAKLQVSYAPSWVELRGRGPPPNTTPGSPSMRAGCPTDVDDLSQPSAELLSDMGEHVISQQPRDRAKHWSRTHTIHKPLRSSSHTRLAEIPSIPGVNLVHFPHEPMRAFLGPRRLGLLSTIFWALFQICMDLSYYRYGATEPPREEVSLSSGKQL